MMLRIQLRSGCGDGNVGAMLDPDGPSVMRASVFEALGCVCT